MDELAEKVDVFAAALAQTPIPDTGCPFCGERGAEGEQAHAWECPVRLARLHMGLPVLGVTRT